METRARHKPNYSRMQASDNPIGLNGVCPDVTIHVNSKGYIIWVDKAEGPGKVVNEKGEELTFNDPSIKADMKQLAETLPDDRYNFDYAHGGIKLFTNFSNKEIGDLMIRVDVLESVIKMSKWSAPRMGPIERWVCSYILNAEKIDFVGAMANVAEDGQNTMRPVRDENLARANCAENTGGFILFEDSNTLYNIHDAGTFLIGFALNATGLGLKEIKTGMPLNESEPGLDADQRAMEAGFRYFNAWLKKTIQWATEKQYITRTKKRAIRSFLFLLGAFVVELMVIKINFGFTINSYITWLLFYPLFIFSLIQSGFVISPFIKQKNAVSIKWLMLALPALFALIYYIIWVFSFQTA